MEDRNKQVNEAIELVCKLNGIRKRFAGNDDKWILRIQLDYIFGNYDVYLYKDAFVEDNEIMMRLKSGNIIMYDDEEKTWVLFGRW